LQRASTRDVQFIKIVGVLYSWFFDGIQVKQIYG
jgi:hypothetical protein